jgi:serine/threonine protein kinase
MAAQPRGSTPIVHPLDEPRPVLEFCLTNHEVQVEFPNAPTSRSYATIDIVRANDPHQAYIVTPWIEEISLKQYGGWGCICFGILLPRLEEGVYQMPNPDQCEYVAIKYVNKRVVEAELRNGGQEDPYREILRMRTIGNHVNVLGCIEALHDETNLYIVMPFCENSLDHIISGGSQALSEDQARIVFRQMLENLGYLRDNHICHKDVSIDKCMIYQGRVVFSGLARSFRLPPNALYVHGTNPCGNRKPAYQPPEVFAGEPYNAYGCDLWAAVIILFNLLTGMKLYHRPMPYSDICFQYFIMAVGLSRVDWNAWAEEIWISFHETQRSYLLPIKERHSALSLEVREIFECVLRMDPQDRWDIDAVTASAFMNPPM